MQVVVITGLAQGMGREVAKQLAATGTSVAGFDIDREGIASLEEELRRTGGAHLLAEVDVTDRKAVLRFKDDVLEQYGRADVVLSNVGQGFFGPFEEIDLDKANRCLEINVTGTATILQAFVPSMRERRSGKLIAVSSLVGQIPFPFESIYCASKFAVEGLIRSLRYEVEPFGIKVALIQPAQVSTGFAAKVHKLPPEASPYRKRVARFIRRDEELIRAAPDACAAAAEIVKVVRAPNPKLYNQIDARSRFFLKLNRVLPGWLRDVILLRHMDIA